MCELSFEKENVEMQNVLVLLRSVITDGYQNKWRLANAFLMNKIFADEPLRVPQDI